MEIPCCGIVAVLKHRGEDPYDPKWLRSQWLLIEHPLAKKAMLRLGASIVDYVGDSDEAMEGAAEPEHDPSLVQLRERFDKVSAIVYPTTEKVRFATMTNAFNSLRDEYRPYNTPMRYRAVMAAIFDLGASFRASGSWIQEPSRVTTEIQAWDRHGEKRSAPENFASPPQKRPSSSSSETCSEYNKRWKNGNVPNVIFVKPE
jgi:hypothetical protein